ncbi:MAG: slipin family protein, partial [Candidatus Pacebacteria bacterium]|nr:slipin family protein [Candidatus Paceibacterota bacterium]
MENLIFSPVGIIVIIVILLFHSVKITREYQRGVVFRLGRFAGTRG